MWKELLVEEGYLSSAKAVEGKVQETLESCGFEEGNFLAISKEAGYRTKTAFLDSLVEGSDTIEGIEGKVFFYQPGGKQRSPDFIVVEGDSVELVEAKSSKTKSGYQFNGHLVKESFYYVFCEPSRGFCIRSGKDIMDPEVRKHLAKTHEMMRDLMVSRKADLEKCFGSVNSQGWSYYARPMFTQRNVFE
jgi:hypothetical protein